MMNIDIVQLVKDVKKLVDKNPEYKYKPLPSFISEGLCLYTKSADNSFVGCLLGQAIVMQDERNFFELQKIDNEGGLDICNLLVEKNEEGLTDEGLALFLSKVQDCQDGGSSWLDSWNSAYSDHVKLLEEYNLDD